MQKEIYKLLNELGSSWCAEAMAENEKALCAKKENGKENEKDETKSEGMETLLKDMHILQMIVTFLKYFGFFFSVWLLGRLGFSCQWVVIAAVGYYIIQAKQEKRDWKQIVGQALAKDEEVVIRARLKDLPSWVRVLVHRKSFTFSSCAFLMPRCNFSSYIFCK